MARRAPRYTPLRRLSQLAVAAFFVALPYTNRPEGWGQTEVLGNLAALKLGPLSLLDPATTLSAMLASLSPNTTMLLGLALPLLLALTLGPIFCAWVCPWGMLSELLDGLKRRLGGPLAASPPSPRTQRSLRVARVALLSLCLLASAAIGLPLVSTLSAPRALSALPQELLFFGSATSMTLLLLAVFGALELLLPARLFCRVLCPVGALLGLLRIPRLGLQLRYRREPCDAAACGAACTRRCSWRLDPRHLGHYHGCTNCLACLDACPSTPRSLDPSLSKTPDE